MPPKKGKGDKGKKGKKKVSVCGVSSDSYGILAVNAPVVVVALMTSFWS